MGVGVPSVPEGLGPRARAVAALRGSCPGPEAHRCGRRRGSLTSGVWGSAHSPSLQGAVTLMRNGCCRKCECRLVGGWLLGMAAAWRWALPGAPWSRGGWCSRNPLPPGPSQLDAGCPGSLYPFPGSRTEPSLLEGGQGGVQGTGEDAVRERGRPRKVETPSLSPPTPGIPRNETRVACSTLSVVREISYDGCTALVTMNDCSGSCGTFAM